MMTKELYTLLQQTITNTKNTLYNFGDNSYLLCHNLDCHLYNNRLKVCIRTNNKISLS